ncbi:hypothetical protein ES708_31338 [subsurface metagenome]
MGAGLVSFSVNTAVLRLLFRVYHLRVKPLAGRGGAGWGLVSIGLTLLLLLFPALSRGLGVASPLPSHRLKVRHAPHPTPRYGVEPRFHLFFGCCCCLPPGYAPALRLGC